MAYKIIYFLFKSVAMRNRTKFDWSKPFKFVTTKKQFDEMDTNEEGLIISITQEEPKPEAPVKKDQIQVPQIENIKKVADVKPFAKITPNYIRLPAHLNLPLANRYELTEVDHTFVKTHEDRFKLKGKNVLTCEFLEKAIVQMEMMAGKSMDLPKSKGWMMNYFNKQHKDILQMDNAEQFGEILYNYWKNRREELKFPLLRLLWKPNADEYNHMLAFRPRERDKRSLRRTNRIVQDEIIEELYEEFDVAVKLVDRVQMRQEHKLKSVTAQISSFYAQCKSFVPFPDYLQELKIDDRVKDKQKMKAFHSGLEAYKNRRESFENMTVQEINTNQIDQKQSIVNFLATVVYEAELLGLSYEKLFSNIAYGDTKPRIAVNPLPTAQPSHTDIQVADKMLVQQPKNPEVFVHFSLQRFQDMLIRRFQEEEMPAHHVKPCRDYLQLKRRKVDRYYFGSDDEGEVKDLRKNIAASFKKYQQVQHMTRTISATSQN